MNLTICNESIQKYGSGESYKNRQELSGKDQSYPLQNKEQNGLTSEICFNLALSFFDWTGTGHKKTKEKKPDPGILKGEEKSTEKQCQQKVTTLQSQYHISSESIAR